MHSSFYSTYISKLIRVRLIYTLRVYVNKSIFGKKNLSEIEKIVKTKLIRIRLIYTLEYTLTNLFLEKKNLSEIKKTVYYCVP